jgi:hypothetical protein
MCADGGISRDRDPLGGSRFRGENSSVRTGSYAPVMTVGIVVFGLVFFAGLAIGTRTRRPLAIASVVVGAFSALLVIQANEPFVAFASFALIALVGLVVDSVRETVGLLLGR